MRNESETTHEIPDDFEWGFSARNGQVTRPYLTSGIYLPEGGRLTAEGGSTNYPEFVSEILALPHESSIDDYHFEESRLQPVIEMREI